MRRLRAWLNWPLRQGRRSRGRVDVVRPAPGFALGQDTPLQEEFRLLALNVMSLLEDSADRSLTVFSPSTTRGQSAVATNLSLAMTQHTDVLLLQDDAAGGWPGLAPTGSGGENGHVSAPGSPHVLLIQSTRPGLPPGGGVALAQPAVDFTPLLEEARQRGLLVIVDAPPADQSADAYFFAQKARNVLYVMTNQPQNLVAHQAVLGHLKRLNARVLGVVLVDS